jgi:predicted ATPase
MLRELAEALEVLTAIRPLVFVLEDLHWSDRATLEWLAYVVRRRDAARLLLLGTYRPVEGMVPVPPLRALLAELQHHPQYAELRLDALSEVAVAAYLRQRCGMEPGTAGLPQLVHYRTGGHPLFLVAMVDELVRQRLLETAGEAGGSPKDLAGLREILPASLRQYIEQHLEQVPEADQALMEAASVAGSTFAVAAVAAGVAQAPETLEARYTALARQGQFIRANGTETWPDGTVTACYQFRHALYHEVVYSRVSAGHRMLLHQQIGMRKETGYGARAHEIAAELAVHFERGRDPNRAIQYLQHAADSALRRSAYTDAITHLTNALALLTVLPETAERAQRELDVQLALGPALMATKGMAAPAVEQTYAHARALCQQAGDTPQILRVLFGLWQCYLVRGEVHIARELAAQCLGLAQHQHDPATLLVAHWMLGVTLFYLGEFTLARAHAEQGIVLSNAQQPYTHVCFYGQAPGIGCLGHMAQALWMLGYPDQAQQRSQDALALARELSHPYDVVFALNQAVVVHQLRREGLLAYERAEEVLTFCKDQGFTQQLAMGTILQGWGLAAQGQVDRGMAHMHHGLAASQAAGIGLGRAPVLAQLAEVYWHTRQTAEGLRLLAEALAVMDRTGERWWEVEVHRLTGELLLAQEEGTRQQWVEAEAYFRHALEVAYHQQAKSLELRAAMSMSRLWQQQGKRAEAYALLAPIYGWFTEGFDTADLQEAKVLLEALAR